MDAEKDFEKILYESLPPVYKKRDDNEELERFLKIFADASKDFYEEIYEYDNLFNIDNVDPIILPYIADTLGFNFPYDLDIEEQRKFLKAIPDLYKQKGTIQVFQYLALEVFNWESEVSTNEYIHPSTGASIINIDVTVLADHSSSLSDRLTHYVERFTDFAELFRPVNNKLTTILKYIYEDNGYLRGSMTDKNYSEYLNVSEEELYNGDRIDSGSVFKFDDYFSEQRTTGLGSFFLLSDTDYLLTHGNLYENPTGDDSYRFEELDDSYSEGRVNNSSESKTEEITYYFYLSDEKSLISRNEESSIMPYYKETV
jgi:phage tail-like protein